MGKYIWTLGYHIIIHHTEYYIKSFTISYDAIITNSLQIHVNVIVAGSACSRLCKASGKGTWNFYISVCSNSQALGSIWKGIRKFILFDALLYEKLDRERPSAES
jgi:hypothetical protein